MQTLRTPLFVRKNPGGMFAVIDETRTTGNIFFVNSATGTDTAGYGFGPDAPFASVKFALTQATAGEGDRIYVMPGHTESVTAASGWTGVAGVSVFGLGEIGNRPVITFTTSTAATIVIGANGIHFDNMVFDLTGIASLVTGFSVSANDFRLTNCRVIQATSTNQAVTAITTTAAANRMIVDGNTFDGPSGQAVTNALLIVGGDGHVIRNNYFRAAYAAASGAIQNATTACTNAIVDNNRINNLTASCTKAMVFASGSTGQISENKMQILSGSAPITGAAMSWVGANYYAATIATAGTLI